MDSKKKVTYTKPKVIAQNSVAGSFAAGCPAKNTCQPNANCKACERTA